MNDVAHATALRVLLLEDSPLDAELLMETLKRASLPCDVRWTSNEQEFAQALAHPCDIILSDYSLPGFSGQEALQRVQQSHPDVPFIFVSGVMGEEHAVDMLKLGATDYVMKTRLARLPYAVNRAMGEVEKKRRLKETERALRAADAMYSRIVESLQDYAVILLDEEGVIRSWNSASEAIFGYRLEDVAGRPARMLFVPDDQNAHVFEKELDTAKREGRAGDDRWLMRKDGGLFYATGVTTAIRDESGHTSGFSKIVRDMTQAQEAQLALQAAKDEAERANQAKDRFLAVLSHELRTPLMPIAAAAQLLEAKASVPPECRGLLPMIRRNVALEARLIDDILDLTSISHGKLHLNRKMVDLHELTRAVIEMSAADVTSKRLSVVQHFDAARAEVHGDPARLQQVLWNVLRNAVKFTPEDGTITLSTRLTDDGMIEICCCDSGIGITADALPKLFVPFEQADPGVAQRYGGLGLGLSIAAHLSEAHGGTLTAYSDGQDCGATFVLRLPLAAGSVSRPSAQPMGADTAEASGAAQTTVLVVEDNEDSGEALTICLGFYGYDVTLVSTVRAAKAALAQRRFSLIVTDLGLPDGSGYDVADAVQDGTPLIALTGYGTTDDVNRTETAGFLAHITKPVDPDDLHHVIQEKLAAH